MADPTPTQTYVNQVGFAPEIAPYAEQMLGQAAALTDTEANPYMQYQGERTAQFSPLQTQSYQNAALQGPAYQTQAATGLAGLAANKALGMQYNPSNFTAGQVNAPQLTNFQMQGPLEVQTQRAYAAQMGAAPQAQAAQGTAAQFQGPAALQAQQVAAERVNAPQLQALSMQAAKDVGTQSLTQPGTVDQYMSPYMQSVVGIQQREAQRAADIAKTQTNAQAVNAGAFGGSRQAIMDAEAARNLALQKGDIQAKGSQDAYTQAQSQFNAEQQARLQANLANQGVQQQANLQNLSAGLQTQGLGAQTGLQAQQLNQQTGLQALLANQQTGLQAGQSNQNMQYNTALQNAQLAQQTGMANTANQQQANLANQALMGQYGMQQGQFNQAAAMQNPQLAQQAMLANQQMGYNVNNANLQSLLGTQQLGTGQSMQAQLANQQANNAMNQLNEQSAQYGAGFGLQGAQTALTGANTLGTLGTNQYNQEMGINALQNQYGLQQQAQMQKDLDTKYQDFQNYQNYPYKQLGFMSDIVRGVPLTTTGSSVYTAPPSTAQNIASLGLGAAGISKLFSGGSGSANGGLIGMAEGGMADGGAMPQIQYAHAFDNGSGYARGGLTRSGGIGALALSKLV